jgi:hypothetical protein
MFSIINRHALSVQARDGARPLLVWNIQNMDGRSLSGIMKRPECVSEKERKKEKT